MLTEAEIALVLSKLDNLCHYYAHRLAKRFWASGNSHEDFVQDMRLGVLMTLTRFQKRHVNSDPARYAARGAQYTYYNLAKQRQSEYKHRAALVSLSDLPL
jgi:DNA-directed RNA polymerase specialized sigma24 family protein